MPIEQVISDDALSAGSGYKLNFYSTGTTTRKDTFSDDALTSANANPVVADSAGRFGDIFLESGTYKVVLTDAADVEKWTADPVEGSIGSSGAVDEITTNTTITLADATKILAVDATSGNITITLLAAATAGDGFEITVKKTDASANTVTIDGNGAETIEGETTLVLTEQWQAVTIRSDASNWLRGALSVQPTASSLIGTDSSGNLDSITIAGNDLTFAGSVITGNLPWAHLVGLGLSNGTDADHDIDVAIGECRSAADDADIILTARTKQLDATWVTGTAQGGLSSSLTAPANNTWYHVHAILVGGTADVGFDTSLTAANLVTDHSATTYRRLGSVLTDGSANIIAFLQVGDEFQWDAPQADIDVLNPGTSAVLRTLSTPLGVKTSAKFVANVESETGVANGSTIFSDPDTTDTAASTGNMVGIVNLNSANGGLQMEVMTDTSSQIRTRATASGTNTGLEIHTFGWTDRRGRDG